MEDMVRSLGCWCPRTGGSKHLHMAIIVDAYRPHALYQCVPVPCKMSRKDSYGNECEHLARRRDSPYAAVSLKAIDATTSQWGTKGHLYDEAAPATERARSVMRRSWRVESAVAGT